MNLRNYQQSLNLSTIGIKSFKLKQNLTKSSTLSIFRTNISYINANHQNLETLLVNHLDHKFDVAALSETWTPEN